MSCPFCTIDLSRTRILDENTYTKVILSNPRLTKGHLLVIPKRHVEKLSQLSILEREQLFDMVVSYQDKILSSISNGCDIRQNYRPFQEENEVKVDHLHIHLIPRSYKDEYYEIVQKNEKELFTWIPDSERNKPFVFLG